MPKHCVKVVVIVIVQFLRKGLRMSASNLATPITTLRAWNYHDDSSHPSSSETANIDTYTPDNLDAFLSFSRDDLASVSAFLHEHPRLFGLQGPNNNASELERSIIAVFDSQDLLNLTMWLYARSSTFHADTWERRKRDYDIISEEGLQHRYIWVDPSPKHCAMMQLSFMTSPYTQLLESFIDTSETLPIAPWYSVRWPFPHLLQSEPGTAVNAIVDALQDWDWEWSDVHPTPDDHVTFIRYFDEQRIDATTSSPLESDITTFDVADEIMTFHLHGVRTVVRDRREERIVDNGISALWWLALDRMRNGRIYECDACGKIGIATNERGHKRRFCSDACKQWRSQHQNKDGQGNFTDWLPPRR